MLFIKKSDAQYFPIFSQYISNGLMLNPAYSGSREVLSLNLLYRNDGVGFDGAPVFQYLTANAPLKNAHIGLGFLVENVQYGAQRNTQVYFNYAYRINVGSGKLSLGLKGGVESATFNLQNLSPNHPDQALFVASPTYFLPNIGVGIYYYSRRAFVGASIPWFLSHDDEKPGSGITNNINNYVYLITAGYLLDISRDLKIKPSTLIRYNSQLQHQYDFNLNFILFNNKLSVGGGYRMNTVTPGLMEAICGIAEIQINPQLRLGYAYDYSSSNSYYKYNSQEISLRYEFSYKIKAINPRYF